jgi:hypothetical protein
LHWQIALPGWKTGADGTALGLGHPTKETRMPLLKRASLAVLLLCLPCAAGASDTAQWANDPATGCALFDASLKPGDTVRWNGACPDGRAEGAGTATFFSKGTPFESFMGSFSGGVAQDGAVTVSWGNGWSYDGEMAHGRFDGEGILVNDSHDHFEGLWNSGKLDGMGSVIHENGERYDGAWKNDLPNGHGILTRADGSKLEGEFRDGKFATAAATPVSLNSKQAAAPVAPQATPAGPETSGLSGLTGKKLLAVDGAALNLTAIEGGIERDISGAGATLEKTTFIFINERLGTVVADAGPSSATMGAANVTGFFRLTDNGVEVRYADGRSEILAANIDGGVLLRQETPGAPAACRSFYPAGHNFSEAEKKAAVAEYASRLGLSDSKPGCPGDVAATATPAAPDTKPHAERRTDIKHPAKFLEPKFTGPKFTAGTTLAALAPVTVKESAVHAIDAAPPIVPMPQGIATAAPSQDASACLKVESDGHHWGFRNACGFDVQFAYCLAAGGDSLTGCGNGGVAGSVAAGGFGALLADKSFRETDADHAFRWLACGGGSGEVVAHLDRIDPPAGRCLRATDLAREDGPSLQGDKK